MDRRIGGPKASLGPVVRRNISIHFGNWTLTLQQSSLHPSHYIELCTAEKPQKTVELVEEISFADPIYQLNPECIGQCFYAKYLMHGTESIQGN
jgi:hypothetical protein